MFRPNSDCTIHAATGQTDVYGMPAPARQVRERCVPIKLMVKNEKTPVRADSSASRGNARELEADSMFLLTKFTVARIDDVIEFAGSMFLIASKFPRFDLQGNLDHYEVTCTYWKRV